MDETARTKLLAPVKNPMVKSFWNSFSRWKHDQQEKLIESTRRRVSNFLADPFVLEIVGQGETTVTQIVKTENFWSLRENSFLDICAYSAGRTYFNV